MNSKIVGILISILLITNFVSPVTSSINEKVISENKIFENTIDTDFIPGEFIIKLKKDISFSKSSFDALNEKYNVQTIEEIFPNKTDTLLDNIYIYHVPIESDILSIIKEYDLCSDVVYAEPNWIVNLCSIPNDIYFNNQWHYYNIEQKIYYFFSGKFDADIDAPEAWDIETGSPDVVIAIIDSGIDYTHPDLVDNIWRNHDEIPENGIDDDKNGFIDDIIGWDFIGDPKSPTEPDNDPLDDMGHGTHCSGIASAVSNNNIGIAGVCWNCKIMPLKVFNKKDFGSSDMLANAIVYAADNGANVISMSWYTRDSGLLYDAVNYAYSKDVVLVSSAGNNNNNRKIYPAAYDDVIAVAATDYNDDRAFFSSYGGWVDVAAPGLYIYSTMPTYLVKLNFQGLKLNYDYMMGTSMSCPMVAGLAALLLSYNINLTPDEIRNIILSSTDWISTKEYIGNGRINAYKALLLASGVTVPPNKPDPPLGKIFGHIKKEYNYTAITVDLDEDELYYLFDWGDGTYSVWIGPFISGTTVNATHKWNKKGNYQIKVKARDSYGVESEWSDFQNVSIKRSRFMNLLLFGTIGIIGILVLLSYLEQDY